MSSYLLIVHCSLSIRAFRNEYHGRKMWGLDMWFVIHRTMMSVTVILTVAGFIFIV